MKTQQTPHRLLSGNTLVIVLVITGVLGFLLVAYLSLVRSQNISNMRSQSWNQAIPVIEAGIEDALTHLNNHGNTNLYCDNWNRLGEIYYRSHWVGNNGNYYLVTISNWVAGETNTPHIESRGFVIMPTIIASGPTPILADFTAPNGTSLDVSSFLGRGVKVDAKKDFLWTKPISTDGIIDLKGKNVITDSFDSADPLNNGTYNPARRRDKGDIATNSGLTNSINIGNADIYGHMSTGPNGSVTIGPLGSVGSLAWHSTRMKGIQKGYLTDDMNVDFEPVDPPFTDGYFTPSSGTNYDGIVYKYLLTGGIYEMDSLTLSGSETMYITNSTTLYVTGDISISGSAAIIISTGAVLSLYVAGANADLGGNGVLNYGGRASNFCYFGLPSNVNLDIGGNAGFSGAIYAPNADIKLNGDGSSKTNSFIGALVGKTLTMNGHFQIHYDEDLGTHGLYRRYIVTRWDEMSPQEMSMTYIDTSPRDAIR